MFYFIFNSHSEFKSKNHVYLKKHQEKATEDIIKYFKDQSHSLAKVTKPKHKHTYDN